MLEVHGKPQIQKEIKEIELDAHDQLTIRLPINSRPEPDGILYVNGESLYADIRTEIEVAEGVVVVTRKGMRKAVSS